MTMDPRLYQASVRGDTALLKQLLYEDELILDRVLVAFVPETPLQIAILRGHVEFAIEILRQRPAFACEFSSQGLTPLHLASATGSIDIVKELLKVVPDSFSDRDREGRSPLHIAAIKGRVELLNELYHNKPESIRDLTSRGETVLHLCVKHDQVEALKMLVGLINDADFLKLKDDNGNTLFHISIANRHISIIKFLVECSGVEVNGRNNNGLTALDVLAHSPSGSGDMEIAEFLRKKGAKRSWELSEQHPVSQFAPAAPPQQQPLRTPKSNRKEQKHYDKMREIMLLVAVLIITVTYQAPLTPPGGFWQDNEPTNTTTVPHNTKGHIAGTSILGDKEPVPLIIHCFFNRVGFVAALLLVYECLFDEIPTVILSCKILVTTALVSMVLTYITGILLIAVETGKTLTILLESSVCFAAFVLALSIMLITNKYGRRHLPNDR